MTGQNSWIRPAVIFATALVVFLAAYLNINYYFYSVSDDSYISIRYARNFLETGKLFYNSHELTTGLVQGFSNPGMLPVYAALLLWSPDIILTLKILGAGCLVIECLFVFLFCFRKTGKPGVSFTAAVTLAVSPIAGVCATSGLETFFLAFLLLFSFLAFCSRNSVCKLLSAIGFGYCVTMRPEAILLAGILVALFLFSRAPVMKLLSSLGLRHFEDPPDEVFGKTPYLWIGTFLATVAVYISVELNYYGSIFPNTATTKTAGSTLTAYLSLNAYTYLLDFFLYNPAYGILSVGAILAALILLFRRKVPFYGFLALLFASPGFALALIGREDYFTNFRYIAPYLPLFLIGSGIVLSSYLQTAAWRTVFVPLAALIWAYGLYTDAITEHVPNNKTVFKPDVYRSHKQAWWRTFGGTYSTPFAVQSDIFTFFAPENGTVCYGNIGRTAISVKDVQMLDSVGLVTREFAQYRAGVPAGSAAVRDLLQKFRPQILVIGEGDSSGLKVIEPVVDNGYLERNWLPIAKERVFVDKNLVAEDGSSRVPLELVLRRVSDTYRMLPHDAMAAARYRDLLYITQRVDDLFKLTKKFKKSRDLERLSTPLSGLHKYRHMQPRSKSSPSAPEIMLPAGKKGDTVATFPAQSLLTFKLWKLNLPENLSSLRLTAQVCQQESCSSLGEVVVSSSGPEKTQGGSIAVVFDRFQLIYPERGQVFEPQMVLEYLGLGPGRSAGSTLSLPPSLRSDVPFTIRLVPAIQ